MEKRRGGCKPVCFICLHLLPLRRVSSIGSVEENPTHRQGSHILCRIPESLKQQVRKMWPTAFKFSRRKKLERSLSRANATLELQHNSSGKLNVNEEYREACRTNSYIEIWTKVHDQMGITSDDQQNTEASHSDLFNNYNFLEPHFDSMLALTNDTSLHELILDYFNGSTEAFKICCRLLESINKTRMNYMIIRKALSLIKRTSIDSVDRDQHHLRVINELVQFVDMGNPFSAADEAQFSRVHDLYRTLVERLTNTNKTVIKRAKVIGMCRKASAMSLVFVCGALSVAILVFSAHTIVGVMTLPLFVSSTFTYLTQCYRTVKRLDKGGLFKLNAQLDAAAKGAYILERHFDTMSRIMTRLYNEIEHTRALITIFLRNQKGFLLIQVVKEIENSKDSFLEQLKELEELVYLCFVTNNRARMLVLQVVVAH